MTSYIIPSTSKEAYNGLHNNNIVEKTDNFKHEYLISQWNIINYVLNISLVVHIILEIQCAIQNEFVGLPTSADLELIAGKL